MRLLSAAVDVDPQGEALPSTPELGEFELEDSSSFPEYASSLFDFEIVWWNEFLAFIVGEYHMYDVLRGSE